ncbi:MAG: YihA family ribosome biogenesis GTP-binding protein [Clostridia bacterium]|nr:YihA family ribosome biogenesis GTP-binding protein [Clostridia bacterium]
MKFNNIEYTASYGTAEQLKPSVVPEIVFAGRSNVGKSSLINKLFNRKNLARVSSVPGKTVTVNFYKGDGVNFVDLPGYGYAKRNESEKKRWAQLMEGYFNSGRSIALVTVLIDMRHPPTADDMTMLSFLLERGLRFTIVLTKCDKLNKSELAARRESLLTELADYRDIEKTEFSSVTGAGIDDLKRIIENAVE